MYCINCGKEIDENSKFCKFCGINFEEKRNIVKKNKNTLLIIVISALLIMLLTLLNTKTHITAITIGGNDNLIEKSLMQYPFFTGTRALVEVKPKKIFQKIDKATMLTTQYRIEQNLIKYGHYDSIVQQVGNNKFIVYVRDEFDIKEIEKIFNFEQPILQFKYVIGEYGKNKEIKYKNTNLGGADIEKATLENLNGNYVINIKFNPKGTKKFADLTKELIGKPLAIFVNDNLISAPYINEQITNGVAQITSPYSNYDEVKEIVAVLNTENTQVAIKILETK